MSIHRIIFNPHFMDKPIRMEGTVVPDAWDVRIWEVNGHREISARNVIAWEEDADWVAPVDQSGTLKGDEMEEERRLKALEKSAKRAQTMCRRVIKAEAFDEMLTLTYRENQLDRALCKVHFKEWVRRMKRALGEFRYCASFERQERGSMHVHIATNRLPVHADYKGVRIDAWKLGTKVWRSIVGDNNGLCFVGGKSKFGAPRRQKLTLAKMASYVSKYILKDFADAPESSARYSRSRGADIPKPAHVRLTGMTLCEVIQLAFQCGDGDVVVSHNVGRLQDSYWLCTEPNPGLLRA